MNQAADLIARVMGKTVTDVKRMLAQGVSGGERSCPIVLTDAQGKVIAACQLFPVTYSNFPEMADETSPVGHLSTVVIDPACQGQGLSYDLMDVALTEAVRRKFRQVALVARPEMQPFYLRNFRFRALPNPEESLEGPLSHDLLPLYLDRAEFLRDFPKDRRIMTLDLSTWTPGSKTRENKARILRRPL